MTASYSHVLVFFVVYLLLQILHIFLKMFGGSHLFFFVCLFPFGLLASVKLLLPDLLFLWETNPIRGFYLEFWPLANVVCWCK